LRFIIIPGETSRCVQTEIYLLRYGSLHSRARQTLEVVLPHRLHFRRRGLHAAELRADAKTGRSFAGA